MWAKTPLGTASKVLTWTYQMWAGLSILEDTTLCLWILDCWLLQICCTLHEHHIWIQHKAWMLPPICSNNIHIMDAILDLNLTCSQQQQLNACWMFLQVTTLAEISDHTGTKLLPQAFYNPMAISQIERTQLFAPQIANHPSTVSSKLETMELHYLHYFYQFGQRPPTQLLPWPMDSGLSTAPFLDLATLSQWLTALATCTRFYHLRCYPSNRKPLDHHVLNHYTHKSAISGPPSDTI